MKLLSCAACSLNPKAVGATISTWLVLCMLRSCAAAATLLGMPVRPPPAAARAAATSGTRATFRDLHSAASKRRSNCQTQLVMTLRAHTCTRATRANSCDVNHQPNNQTDMSPARHYAQLLTCTSNRTHPYCHRTYLHVAARRHPPFVQVCCQLCCRLSQHKVAASACVLIYQQALRGELAAGRKRNCSNAQWRHNLHNNSSSGASTTRQKQFHAAHTWRTACHDVKMGKARHHPAPDHTHVALHSSVSSACGC
jgi:hypothetical protein